jgi:hypothetical protein
MMKEKDMTESIGNKLSYSGDDAEGYSVHTLELAGRPVVEFRASKDEKDCPIYMRQAGSPLGWTKTCLRAFVGDENNQGFTHITSDSMKNSIYGNLPYLLADLLVGPVVK